MKSKTASVRLPKDMYEEIDELCDGIGCSRNDWIKDTLQEKLREESNETDDQEPKEEPKRIDNSNKPKKPLRIYLNDEPKVTVTRIDEPKPNPKVIITLNDEPEPKPIFEEKPPNIPAIMRYIDDQWRPYATRYST